MFAFTSNFRVFSDLDISKNEFRVLTYILEYMKFGNLINLSQSSLCKSTEHRFRNMSNILKTRQKGILCRASWSSLYPTLTFSQKGMSHQLDQKRKEQLSNARNLLRRDRKYPETIQKHSQKRKKKTDLPGNRDQRNLYWRVYFQ